MVKQSRGGGGGRGKKWMSKATHPSRRGEFTRYCKSKGYKGVTDKCIDEALKSGNKRRVKQAQFAKAARTVAKRHRRAKRK